MARGVVLVIQEEEQDGTSPSDLTEKGNHSHGQDWMNVLVWY
jgi:hypothetical protein